MGRPGTSQFLPEREPGAGGIEATGSQRGAGAEGGAGSWKLTHFSF